MKNHILMIGALASSVSILHAATTFMDSTNEVAVPGNPHPHLDITSVVVSNTLTNLTLKINLNGDPVATDWGKYMIGINTTSGGDIAGNGWGRPITMQDGMNYWVGAWADGGNGAQLWNYSGAWAQISQTNAVNPANISIFKDSSSISLSMDFASLGLSDNNSFKFDVYTSGGGGSDSAVDALSRPTPSILEWGSPYQTSSAEALSYTLIPEPTSAALGLLGSLLLLRRQRIKNVA